MKKILFSLISLFLCFPIFSQTINDFRRYFSYDLSQDLNFRVFNTIDTTQATIFNIQYTGGNNMQVTAYLIIPKNQLRRYPAIIFLHGLGQDKTTFLSNALELANKSIATLLIDAPSARPNSQRMTHQNYSEPRKEALVHRQTVIDVRRGVDLLFQHPKIDPDRIAFVGIDYGAWDGAIVAGIENRILSYVLIGCPLQPSLSIKNSDDPQAVKVRNTLTPEQIIQYETTMKEYDPINYLAYHRNSIIFFQYSDNDPTLPKMMTEQAFQIASDPKKIQLYPFQTSELISSPDALKDRRKWLYDNL